MRRELLAVVGGSFYHETPVILQFRGEPAIWFNRDEEGYLLLNVRMLTTSGQPRISIQDNFWIEKGEPEDLECPPSGKRIRVKYANGDELMLEFFELQSITTVQARYPDASAERWPDIIFPITAVEIQEKVGGIIFEFGPRYSKLPGGMVIMNYFSSRNRVGLALD